MEIRNMTEKEFEEFQQLLARELGAVDKEKEKEEKEITEMLRHEGAAYEAARTVGKSLRDFAARREAEERAAAEKIQPAEKKEPAEESIDIEEMLKHDVQPAVQSEPEPQPKPQPEAQPQVARGKYEKVTELSDEPKAPKASELLKKPGKYEKITEEAEGYFNPEHPRESAVQRRRRARKQAVVIRYAVGLSALFIISLSAGLLVNSIKNNAKTDGEDKPVSAVPDENVTGESNIVSITPVNNYTALLAGAEKPVQISMATTGAASAQDLLWASSDTSVAEITEDGIIKGIAPGTCDITISAKADPSISAQISCTVRKMEKKDGVTFVDGILLINKSYGVEADYDPGDLTEETQNAFNELCQAAAIDGMNIYLASGYRSYETQGEIYDGYVVMYGEELADTFSARPGFSEHQSGLAIDVNSIDDSFAETPEAEWLAKNCMDYGFIIRYAKEKVGITGYKYEPWHIRYVGKELAGELTKLGLTLEEYLGVDSVYADVETVTNEDETESTTEE